MSRRSQIFRRGAESRPQTVEAGDAARQTQAKGLAARIFGTVLLVFGGGSLLLGLVIVLLAGPWSGFQEGIAGVIGLSIMVPGFIMFLIGFLARRFAARTARQQE